jgi:hypothetical protein
VAEQPQRARVAAVTAGCTDPAGPAVPAAAEQRQEASVSAVPANGADSADPAVAAAAEQQPSVAAVTSGQ